jgi:hypothetical protein
MISYNFPRFPMIFPWFSQNFPQFTQKHWSPWPPTGHHSPSPFGPMAWRQMGASCSEAEIGTAEEYRNYSVDIWINKHIYAYIYIILLIHINVLVCTWLFKAMCISIGISIGINQCQIPLSHLRRCEDGLLHLRRALARANASLAWRSARPIPSASHVINTGGLLIKNDQKWRGSDGFTEITEMGIITWPIYANIVLNILCMPAPMWTNPVRNNVF